MKRASHSIHEDNAQYAISLNFSLHIVVFTFSHTAASKYLWCNDLRSKAYVLVQNDVTISH